MSKRSWVFNPGDSASILTEKIRQDCSVDAFDLAIVLGSGWGDAARFGELLHAYDYSDWPCFPAGQIAGHHGRLQVIRHADWHILVFSGRFHCYQGFTAFEASLPIRLAHNLGCRRVLLTCATGGINNTFSPGDFMLVDDHINLLGDNPLKGFTEDPFVDMVGAYSDAVYKSLLAKDLNNLTVHRGVLAAMPGPSYETPAEIHFLRTCGADVVSMSIVHETIMARYLDLQVAAVAFISNLAAGTGEFTVSHADVLDCSQRHAEDFPKLVRAMVAAWQETEITS